MLFRLGAERLESERNHGCGPSGDGRDPEWIGMWNAGNQGSEFFATDCTDGHGYGAQCEAAKEAWGRDMSPQGRKRRAWGILMGTAGMALWRGNEPPSVRDTRRRDERVEALHQVLGGRFLSLCAIDL